MRTLNKSDNQIGMLDPEKIYFVEKFGYLIKKINGGYGGPVQEALFDRINNAVKTFKTDLPNIVHDLEINRLKSIADQNKAKIDVQDRKTETRSKVSTKSEEITKTISEKITNIQKSASEKVMADAKLKSDRLQQMRAQSSEVNKPLQKDQHIGEVIEIEIDVPNPKLVSKQQSRSDQAASSILKPSIAIIREEQRLEQLKVLHQKRESVSKKPVEKPRPISVPPELTEWERKWHKYDSDIIGEEFNGYS